jgi:hypothetical protein
MNCPHCASINSAFVAFTRPIEGGRAYAQSCGACGRVIGIRPRVETDPPTVPADFSLREIARLEFTRWRLAQECVAQVTGQETPTRAAAA